jgi:hypothetical protein
MCVCVNGCFWLTRAPRAPALVPAVALALKLVQACCADTTFWPPFGLSMWFQHLNCFSRCSSLTNHAGAFFARAIIIHAFARSRACTRRR